MTSSTRRSSLYSSPIKTKAIPFLTIGILACLTVGVQATTLTDAQKPAADAFSAMRYGMFNHMVFKRTIAPAGRSITSPSTSS